LFFFLATDFDGEIKLYMFKTCDSPTAEWRAASVDSRKAQWSLYSERKLTVRTKLHLRRGTLNKV